MFKFFSSIFDLNQKEIDRLGKVVDEVNAHEGKFKNLKADEFVKKTAEFRKLLRDGATPTSILPEAFALVREASWRTIGQRHFDVQMMAGAALFEGKVIEQKTGEGKTLTAVPALYVRALASRGAHLVTVNDYLARIGAGWMGPIFDLLGLSVGAIIQENKSFIFDPSFNDTSHGDERLAKLRPVDRREAYSADITYGTNNEFGFDYLRDNMVGTIPEMVQRGHFFAIVDEVDSVLIDEARTPLIISAPDTEPTKRYYEFAKLIDKLNADTDFTIDEKYKSATLTDHGITRVEKLMGVTNLYEKDWAAIHHIENALRARGLYLKDKDYVVKEGQVIIVDEFTGRLMVGRRWSDGLHQAVEAKEGVAIQQESRTMATISFQNYFRMYEVLSGMTGTAVTEAEEFKKIYKLDVVAIPTNRAMVRKDAQDVIYKTQSAKYSAVAKEIEEAVEKGRPILVGTTSIEKNEIISSYLKKKKIVHSVLNAKNHEKEASIIAQAGKPGAVTVATNMAGRGVDIVLGGAVPERPFGTTTEKYQSSSAYKKWQASHDKVVAAGGLHVIGTERHESRRIDNQLRGRSGRQGDPGSSKFYLSLEDDLMRIFGGTQISAIMDRLNLPEDQPIENSLITKAIEQAQIKVEGFNFDARKSLVGYDDVINQQRNIIYGLRKKVLESDNLRDEIREKFSKEITKIVSMGIPVDAREGAFDYEEISVELSEMIPFDTVSRERIQKELTKYTDSQTIQDFLEKVIDDVYASREKELGPEVIRNVEKFAYRSSIDRHWMDHIDTIDSLRHGVGIRGRNDEERLVLFKTESFDLFENLINRIDTEVTRRFFRIGISATPPTDIPLNLATTNVDTSDTTGLSDVSDPELGTVGGPKAFVAGEEVDSSLSSSDKSKIGRNDPCWCGSGKKWKKCHYPQLASS